MRLRVRESALYACLRLGRLLDARPADPAQLGTAAIRRILIISSTAIGDTLMSTPAIRSLRMAYHGAKLSLLVHHAYHELFANNPDVDELIDYPGGYKGFVPLARILAAGHYDLACILHGNEPQATPLAWFSGARFIFKLPATSRFAFALSNAPDAVTGFDALHVIRKRLAIAGLAGGLPTDERMTLPIAVAASKQADDWLRRQGIETDTRVIAFQTGASEAHRRWPMDRFAALAKRLLASHPALHIVLTGSPAERPACQQLVEAVSDPGLHNAAGEFSLAVLPALLARCVTLVTGDTGTMHIAVALGTPVVALFATADPAKTGPSYDLDRHIIIRAAGAPASMNDISVDDVAASAERQLLRQETS